MARIRTIKPGFFTSEDVVSLSPLARLLYIGLWCEADREGRLNWRPRTLKLKYLPADDCDIDGLCAELVAAGLVQPYEVDGKAYALIPTFPEHQVINVREAKSTLPAPTRTVPEPVNAVDAPERTEPAPANTSDAQECTVTHVQGNGEGKGREKERKDSEAIASDAGASPPPRLTVIANPDAEPDLTLPAMLDRSRDLKAELFGPCLDWLAAGTGKPPAGLRPLVGKWLKDWGEGPVLEAFLAAQRESPIDPVAWISEALKVRHGKRTGKPTANETARAGLAAGVLGA